MEQEEAKYQRANTDPQEDTPGHRYKVLSVSIIALLTEMFDDSQLPDIVRSPLLYLDSI